MSKRIGIVGGGAAGVLTAYELRRLMPDCELHLFERANRIGGNAQSYRVEHEGQSLTLDCGAQFFHDYPQPTYASLCRDLGFESEIARAPVGLTVWDQRNGEPRLHIPSSLASLTRYRPADWHRLVLFARYLAYGMYLEQTNASWSITLGDWLAGLRLLPRAFCDEVILPFNYQFLSLPLSRMREGSARYALSYFLRKVAGPLGGPHRWLRRESSGRSGPDAPSLPFFETLQNLAGVESVLQKALSTSSVETHLGEPVREVRSRTVVTEQRHLEVDHVVLACEPPAAARIVRASFSELADALDGLEVVRLPISITRGSDAVMPGNRRYWQPVNTLVDGESVRFTVWFAPLRQPRGCQTLRVFKTWGTSELSNEMVGELMRLEHQVPLPTGAFMRKRQALLQRFQGTDCIWVAGGWTQWFDSQESALRSAQAVADGIAGQSHRASARPQPLVNGLRRALRQMAQWSPPAYRSGVEHAVDDVEWS